MRFLKPFNAKNQEMREGETPPATPRPETGSRRMRKAGWFWTPLLAFLITRLGIAAVAYFSTPIFFDSNVPPYHIRPDHVVVDVFASRWDTGFYLSIAENGYRYEGERLPSVAFFPLLPVFVRGLGALTGDALLGGLLITNLALLGAAYLLYRVAQQAWGHEAAERAVWYLLIFPTSFFGSAIYSESLFLFFAILALYLARRKVWLGAAMAGVLAALTRLLGILVAPLLFFEWLGEQKEWRRENKGFSWKGLAASGAPFLGTGVYMLYLQLTFGDALAFSHASAAWGRMASSPLQAISGLFERPVQGWMAAISAGSLPLDNWVDLLFVLVFIGFGTVLLFQRQWSEGTFVLLGALLPLSSGLLMSQRRYIWVLFPAFILLGRWGAHPWVDRAITAISLLGLGLFTALFANWYWVG